MLAKAVQDEVSMYLAERADLLDVDGIIIMDAAGTALKTAELVVDLKAIGINRSPRYYSSPPPDVLEAMKKVYGV